MKETKNVPQLRFSGFDDNWKKVIFSEIFTERHDISTITKEYPQLSFTIAEGVIRPEDRKTNQRDFLIKDKENKQYLKTELNDIIYNPANVIFGAIHRNGLGKGVLSPIYKIFYTKEDSVFLEGIVRNPEFIKKIANQTEGTVTKLKTLKPENFLQMRSFISPYLQEQQKIGTFLSHVDSLIQAKTKKLESLKAVKKSLLQKCFPKAGEKVPEMRFAEFSGDWEEKKLGDMGTTFTGLSGKSKEDFGYGNARYLTYISVYKNEISSIEGTDKINIDNSQNTLKYGDILFTTSSEIPEEVGLSSVWLGNEDNIYLNSFCFGYRLRDNVDLLYMAYLLRSFYVRPQIILLAQGISRYNISKYKVMDVKVLLPSLTEQQKIGQFFSKYDSLISAQQKEIDKLKDIKKSLLQKMFI